MHYDLLTINSDIEQTVMQEVLRIHRDTINDRLLIVLNTRGGDPFLAYRAMQHLGSLYKTIEVIIPNKAMSAGTLMCMGADKIYMYEGSSLGPLDLQVPHPNDGGRISTIDIRQSTYNIFGLTTKVAKQLYIQAVNDMEVGKNQAAKIAHDAAVSLLKPMVEKIDPYHLHASYRAASIGQKYAYILLASRMMKENLVQAKATSKILAEDYETHSYSITMEEAKDYLGLNVGNITDLNILQQIQSLVDTIPEGVNYAQIRNMPSPTEAKLDKESKNGDKQKPEE